MTISTPSRVASSRPKDTYTFLDNNVLVCSSHDNTIRWAPGERLEHLYEQRADTLAEDHLAVVTNSEELTFQQLDQRGNQLARYLIQQGVKPGDRVGLILDKSAQAYISMLGVMKAQAAYVPMDASFPIDRIEYISQDAQVKLLLTVEAYKERLQGASAKVLCLDSLQAATSTLPAHRLSKEEHGHTDDELAYIIYTSGSTGHPKGVAIDHPSICNFVRVAAEVYGIRSDDRIYQGMTLAFDFSVEEIWVPLMTGATLVPGQSDANLVGAELAEFIKSRHITALCCVPTLLATIDEDIEHLRFILVSGEACPQDIVRRWYRKDRILLNAYGPTEATVTATLTELYPNKPVTIGGPLPTYYAMILPEDEAKALPKGEVGELCVAGIALAREYVNRPEQTQRAFIPDFLELSDNPSHRIYRTGDLARINDDNEIEYLGRIDTQVKIRGYRIELTEIESVFMQLPDIAQAVVDTFHPEEGVTELVGYYTLREDVERAPSAEQIIDTLRQQLPGYMVPSYLEKLTAMPMLPSHKVDRKKLPTPTGPRVMLKHTEYVAPEGELQLVLAGAIADIMKMDVNQISATDDFFKDLGAHSLLMAKFATKVRERQPGLQLAMRDIYLHPSVQSLAAHLEQASTPQQQVIERDAFHQASTGEYLLCGALQLLTYVLSYTALLALGITIFDWIIGATSAFGLFSRVFFSTLGLLIFFAILPVAVKKLLIGTWKEERIPIWSMQYFRFWFVRLFIETNPFVLFKGTPVFNFYLRLLGADIGREVVYFGSFVPLCTDMLTIGDHCVFQRASMLSGYKAENGYIYTGPITVGNNVYVGEKALIDIHTELGDDAQLGHSSALLAHRDIPAGKTYHGSPAIEAQTNYRKVEVGKNSTLRKTLYLLAQFVLLFSLALLPFMLIYNVLPQFFGPKISLFTLSAWTGSLRSLFAWDTLLLSVVAMAVFIGFGILFMIGLPRLLALLLVPGKTYPLYGPHHLLFSYTQLFSNVAFFKTLFGDSSFKPHFLKWMGWGLGKVLKQTGTNFGLVERQDIPTLCEVGTGTMVSDGLDVVNASFSTSSFVIAPASIGDESYVGTSVLYPYDARVGNNCLLATRVMVPTDGEVKHNVGLLGAPAFEIPRSTFVEGSLSVEELEAMRLEKLPEKNKYNLITIGSFLLSTWFLFVSMLVFAYVGFLGYADFGVISFVAVTGAAFVYYLFFAWLLDWMSRGYKSLHAMYRTIYDKDFWQIENYWKLGASDSPPIFRGTPFRPLLWRLLGVKMGARVFDDGVSISERTLLEVGDDTILNRVTLIQSHSLEDGFYKSEPIKIGKRCTIGAHALIHYGTELQDDTLLEADAYLMKGETTSPNSIWVGNPAHQQQDGTTPKQA
ncbi:MAG: peptide synthetase [Deltaproteobacteria bacterium]|nr:peptide synthetase [Deltaproteobacteria bacterium]MBU48666.1 peptide synthetase [Deltaproteobacteria bacterium]|tara:strand:+ start:14050 stop:18156 length:4107 start_codon:yes stop_codon:yes gene_type:complete